MKFTGYLSVGVLLFLPSVVFGHGGEGPGHEGPGHEGPGHDGSGHDDGPGHSGSGHDGSGDDWPTSYTYPGTYSSSYPTLTGTTPASCTAAAGEIICGSVCCAASQYCAAPGQCANIVGSQTEGLTSVYTSTPTGSPYSPPYLVNSTTATPLPTGTVLPEPTSKFKTP